MLTFQYPRFLSVDEITLSESFSTLNNSQESLDNFQLFSSPLNTEDFLSRWILFRIERGRKTCEKNTKKIFFLLCKTIGFM